MATVIAELSMSLDAFGVFVVTHSLAAGLIDELRLHVVPELLGAGERLFDGVGDRSLEQLAVSGTGLVTHLSYRIGSSGGASPAATSR